jgi:hypothetical protein
MTSKIIYRSNPSVAAAQGRDPQPSYIDAIHGVMPRPPLNAKKQKMEKKVLYLTAHGSELRIAETKRKFYDS